eukprot:jgi/Orpsp1_1/1184113/evm.model.c7180000088062.1
MLYYITLEYAMTKSATTSISAGNICTNSNRSIFYFATDTVVVKPNVISGPSALIYYADVNKRILKYDINSRLYSFAYEKDIKCIFANNKCTPNADLKNQEFCVTYKSELVLATTDIKNRETGECYRASSIISSIYGYSQYFYYMNLYSAQMIDQTGYYIISLSTNTTVISKNYKMKNNNIVIYGCTLSSCQIYEPDENVYYYDSRAKTILRYKDGAWNSPSTSGYAFISIDPSNSYVYKFTKTLDDEIKIQSIANYGYYYTVDNEMYPCDQDDDDGECSVIDETGYYFTNSGEVYYCIHDSEELEATECTKQSCINGQYYYINESYYRCEVSSILSPVVSR